LLPNLIERAGVGRNGHGSITAIYTVLAEGDDGNDPIVDIARASLDGQVMLSRKLADAAHYPAIDLNGSISRVMQVLLTPADLKMANRFRRLWSLYQQNQDLIQVGAYEAVVADMMGALEELRQAAASGGSGGPATAGGAKAKAGSDPELMGRRAAVLGGISRASGDDRTTGIPFLGRVPTLGWLFRRQLASRRREELLVFLTPRVLPPVEAGR
jgi:hypothetical protein